MYKRQIFKSECFQTDFFFSSMGSIIRTSREGGGISWRAAWWSSGGSAKIRLGQVMVYGCRVDGVFLCGGCPALLQLHRPHRAAAKEAEGRDPGPGMDRLVSRPAALRLGCVWTAKVQSAESIMLASCKTLANKQRLAAPGASTAVGGIPVLSGVFTNRSCTALGPGKPARRRVRPAASASPESASAR